MIDHARQQGWANKGDFNVKESYGGSGFYTSYLYTVFGNGDERHQRLTGLLAEQKGKITEAVMMDTLRDHGPDSGPDYNPAKGKTQNPPCMHAGAGPIRTSQTTGSLVSHLAEEVPTRSVRHRRALHLPIQAGLARCRAAGFGPAADRPLQPGQPVVAARASAPGCPGRLSHTIGRIPGRPGQDGGRFSGRGQRRTAQTGRRAGRFSGSLL